MRPIVGKLLMVTGVVHVLDFCLPQVYGRTLWQMLQAGLWNTCEHHPLAANSIVSVEHEAAYWGTMGGVFIGMLGLAIHEIERLNNGVLPKRLVWAWGGASLFGTVVMPVSGFPVICLPLWVLMLFRARATPRREGQSP